MNNRKVSVTEIAREETTIREFSVRYDKKQKILPLRTLGIPVCYDYHPNTRLLRVCQIESQVIDERHFKVLIKYDVAALVERKRVASLLHCS